jgi:hypothetical protein
VIEELKDALARVQRLDVGTAVLRNPVDAVRAKEDNELVICRALNHSVHVADLLRFISNLHALLLKKISQTLPAEAAVT